MALRKRGHPLFTIILPKLMAFSTAPGMMMMHDARCLALFDRAADALGSPAEDLPLEGDWFVELMDLYGVALA